MSGISSISSTSYSYWGQTLAVNGEEVKLSMCVGVGGDLREIYYVNKLGKIVDYKFAWSLSSNLLSSVSYSRNNNYVIGRFDDLGRLESLEVTRGEIKDSLYYDGEHERRVSNHYRETASILDIICEDGGEHSRSICDIYNHAYFDLDEYENVGEWPLLSSDDLLQLTLATGHSGFITEVDYQKVSDIMNRVEPNFEEKVFKLLQG